MTNTRRTGHRIKMKVRRPFVLYKCQKKTCCNFFTRDTYNGNPKYCQSHKLIPVEKKLLMIMDKINEN